MFHNNINRSNSSYLRKIESNNCFGILRLALLSTVLVLIVTSVNACEKIPSEWIGKYQGMATACRNDVLSISQKSITFNKCEYYVVKNYVTTPVEYTAQLKPTKECNGKRTVITLKRYTVQDAVNLYNYRSVDNYKNNYSPNMCGYGPKNR